MQTTMAQALPQSTSLKNARVVPVDPHVKSGKTCKLFNAGVSGNSKTERSADPTCYDAVTVEIRTGLFDNVERDMTRDEARGQSALGNLDKYTKPQCLFVSGDGGEGKKLYELERKRNELLAECAKQWAKIADVDKKKYWTRSVPQALHDTLESYQTECGIIAAEAFLERHGWVVSRPEKII